MNTDFHEILAKIHASNRMIHWLWYDDDLSSVATMTLTFWLFIQTIIDEQNFKFGTCCQQYLGNSFREGLLKDLSTCYHSINETGTGSLLLVGWQVLCSAPFLFYFLYYVCLLPWFLGAHLEFRLLPLNWKNQSLLASGSPLCSDPLFISMTFAQVCSSPVPLVWPHPAPWTSSAAVVEWCDS